MFGHVAIYPQYFFTKEKAKEYNRKIEKVVNELVGELHLLECNEYEKELQVHDWICQNVEYDYKGSDKDKLSRVIASHNILGVFAHHKAQCEGIAKAVKVLLNAVDVKCIVVTGDSIYYVQRGCSFQMKHQLKGCIDTLIEKGERIFEFRAEGRLNKDAIEKEVADCIVQKLQAYGKNYRKIRISSNRELGIYRIEIL